MASGEATPPAPQCDQAAPERERKHWLEYAIFAFVILTAAATAAAAWYARQQSLIAADTEQRQLRAYVVVTAARFATDEAGHFKFGLTNSVGRELLIYYDVSNEGVTPAYDLQKAVDVEYPFTGKVSFNVTDGTPAYLTKKHTFGPIRTAYFTDDQIKTISEGKVPFVFAGRISYRDIFGNYWPTYFCFMYVGRPIEPGFDFCARWTDADTLNYAR